MLLFSTTPPLYTTEGSEIKFSDLRRDFKARERKDTSTSFETINPDLDTGSISASDYIRNTTNTEKNPLVPDSSQNSQITSSNSNWSIKDFRGSVKYLYLTLPDTDEVENFDIGDQEWAWDGNLDKNINKFVFIDGVCGSSDTSISASSIDTITYNMTIDVFGTIYGAGGAGGTASSVNGKDGGNALSITPPEGNVVVYVRPDAKIYGGGGGGGKGDTGDNGANGNCINWTYQFKKQCRSCPGCDAGYYPIRDCYNRQGRCETFYQYRELECRKDNNNSVNGGPGGAGGDGRKGRGYDNQSGTIIPGIAGSNGTGGGCGGYNANGAPAPQQGVRGDTGGTGGDWGDPGQDLTATNGGSGGDGGNAITGANYTFHPNSTLKSETIQGNYLP